MILRLNEGERFNFDQQLIIMKRPSHITFLQLASASMFTFLLAGCEKCKDCYIIEEANGSIINEISQGEFCGEALKTEEAKTYNAIQGEIYVDCR